MIGVTPSEEEQSEEDAPEDHIRRRRREVEEEGGVSETRVILDGVSCHSWFWAGWGFFSWLPGLCAGLLNPEQAGGHVWSLGRFLSRFPGRLLHRFLSRFLLIPP